MASFKVKARSSFTVFCDGDSSEGAFNSHIDKKPAKIKLGPNADKENFDPVRKVYLNKLAKKEAHPMTNSASTSKTPSNPTRYKSENSLTPSPLADITEAHDRQYQSPLPLSVSYSTENVNDTTKSQKASGKHAKPMPRKQPLFKSTQEKSSSGNKRSSPPEVSSSQPRKLSRSSRDASESKSKMSALHFRL
ncbi:hypothetical protein K493DRAFT_8301 [Basidiobolus meristosporus CBS 931.73]|uniref:Uncharacterized protein n=1 Tax=Basidiobolus meristosporus CBS 931.73 TaxID=1314790 RepID=A0A1Y1YJR8_9FUNG|nr:hypothetical protein K493DRAFT_8301 [Basidiobolus meristosporus CBS 931.73]|eukprot:ORX98218.1 hypothetical protein K493DRAFT_8301 [Basidiobolus meristosporus CBS 931.73]